MSEIKCGTGRLKPGNVGCDPEKARRPDSHVFVTKYFVGVNIVLADGKLALVGASAYFHTAAAAERELAEIRENYPKAEVLWATTVYDVDDPEQLEELASVIEQTAAEQQQEKYQ
jgi:hypothetical protein